MSAFNTLYVNIKCSNCRSIYEGLIQFKFGDTWQLEYKIGDEIKWGGNDIGRPEISEVKVYGTLDSNICPFCKKENSFDEYDVIIKKDIIIGVNPILDATDYFTEEESYKVCIE